MVGHSCLLVGHDTRAMRRGLYTKAVASLFTFVVKIPVVKPQVTVTDLWHVSARLWHGHHPLPLDVRVKAQHPLIGQSQQMAEFNDCTSLPKALATTALCHIQLRWLNTFTLS